MGNLCVFTYFSRTMQIHFSYVLGTSWISASYEKFRKPLTLKCLCFHIFFPTMGIHFPHIFGIVRISVSSKIFEKPLTLEYLFFPYFSRIMGIQLSHVLEIVLISASPKIFKKPINLKCLCFPILFTYYGNPPFSYFGNCMDFCFSQKNIEFSHVFSLLWEFIFPIFWELYRSVLHMKYVRNL